MSFWHQRQVNTRQQTERVAKDSIPAGSSLVHIFQVSLIIDPFHQGRIQGAWRLDLNFFH